MTEGDRLSLASSIDSDTDSSTSCNRFASNPSQLMISPQASMDQYPILSHGALTQAAQMAPSYQQNLSSPTERVFSTHSEKSYVYPYAYMQSLSQAQLQMHQAAYSVPYTSTPVYASPYGHYIVSTSSPSIEISLQPNNDYLTFPYHVTAQEFNNEDELRCGANRLQLVEESVSESMDDANDNRSPSVISEDTKFSYQSGDKSHTTAEVEYSSIPTSPSLLVEGTIDCTGAQPPYNNITPSSGLSAPSSGLSARQCPASCFESCPPNAADVYPSIIETPPCSPYMSSNAVKSYSSCVPLTPTAIQVSIPLYTIRHLKSLGRKSKTKLSVICLAH